MEEIVHLLGARTTMVSASMQPGELKPMSPETMQEGDLSDAEEEEGAGTPHYLLLALLITAPLFYYSHYIRYYYSMIYSFLFNISTHFYSLLDILITYSKFFALTQYCSALSL